MQLYTVIKDSVERQEIDLLGKYAGTISHWSSTGDIFSVVLHDFLPADGCKIPKGEVAIDFKQGEYQALTGPSQFESGNLTEALNAAADSVLEQGTPKEAEESVRLDSGSLEHSEA